MAGMRVLAVDPALRCTGFAVVEGDRAGSCRAVTFGVVRNPASREQSRCLAQIRTALAALIHELHPDCAAVEGVIYVQSFRTAITLGAARGAALVAMAEAGLEIFEYAPRRVKQAVVGRGGAGKEQVAFMVRALLGLEATPDPDAADALAIGLTHVQVLRRGGGPGGASGKRV
ncbi:MAG TPA: crossover junction endodeoxyribonuclease RuvC [Verrucomicrobiales bacterium]|nr:crossover junction endodeoxyribonuclease RuvC [Verrucomicrobiales bacterium]